MNAKRPLHRPKRAGDDFLNAALRTGPSTDEPSSKRARFSARNPSTLAPDANASDEDAILELDEIGRKGTQTKRNAVELDGYESDSSNENFDARADAKAAVEGRAGKRKGNGNGMLIDEEDKDMFADLEEDLADDDEGEDMTREGKKKSKEVRFLDAAQIEGQVLSSKAGGHVSADFSLDKDGNNPRSATSAARNADASSDDDDDDDDDAGIDDEERRARLEAGMDEELGAGAKKKYAPKLDAFNMRNEEEEGRFDAAGNFVRRAADPFALHDAWLDGAASKTDMRRAREAEQKREEERRRRDVEDDAVSAGEVLAGLIPRLEVGETVLEALARLGSGTKEKGRKKGWQKNKRRQEGGEMDVDNKGGDDEEDSAEAKRREAVEEITAAADRLLTRGQTEIYEAERGALVRQYRRETGEEWIEKAEGPLAGDVDRADQPKEWEYRWADGRDSGEQHGPYDGAAMAAWDAAGYFGEGVEFKRVGEEGWREGVEFV